MVSNAYKATAWNVELPGGRAMGRVCMTTQGLRFDSDHGAVTFPWQGMALTFMGFNEEQAQFTHPSHPGWMVVVGDPAVLRDPVLAEQPAFAHRLKKAERSRKATPWPVKAGMALALLLAAVVSVVFLKRDAIAQLLADRVPVEWERKLGDSILESQKSSGKIVRDDAKWRPLIDASTRRLMQELPDRRFEFTFHVVDDDDMNAFAVPGGHVFIHTGLLRRVGRPEELAGVLGHEMAHILRRHSMRGMIGQLGIRIMLTMLFGDGDNVGSVLLENGSSLMNQKYSRDLEREADDMGFDLLVRSGTDPHGLLEFFQRMRAEEVKQPDGRVGKVLQWFSTHPGTDERMQHLEKRLKEVSSGQRWSPIATNLITLPTGPVRISN